MNEYEYESCYFFFVFIYLLSSCCCCCCLVHSLFSLWAFDLKSPRGSLRIAEDRWGLLRIVENPPRGSFSALTNVWFFWSFGWNFPDCFRESLENLWRISGASFEGSLEEALRHLNGGPHGSPVNGRWFDYLFICFVVLLLSVLFSVCIHSFFWCSCVGRWTCSFAYMQMKAVRLCAVSIHWLFLCFSVFLFLSFFTWI